MANNTQSVDMLATDLETGEIEVLEAYEIKPEVEALIAEIVGGAQ